MRFWGDIFRIFQNEIYSSETLKTVRFFFLAIWKIFVTGQQIQQIFQCIPFSEYTENAPPPPPPKKKKKQQQQQQQKTKQNKTKQKKKKKQANKYVFYRFQSTRSFSIR